LKRRFADGALFAYLTVLVWGLTAPMRGLWQDDVIYLSSMVRRRGHLLKAMFGWIGTPVRRLYGLPAWLASITPRPILTMQLLYGAFWIGHALAAGWIVSILLPRRPLIRFAAIALTLTATSDYLTSNLTAIGYNFAILTLLLAIGSGLRFAACGGIPWLAASVAFLTISVWTVDVAFTAMPFVPLLLLLMPSASRRRSLLLLAVCAAATLPAVFAEWRFLHNPKEYAAIAFIPLAPREFIHRAFSFFFENFKPWDWVFGRRLMGQRPPMLMPMRVMAALSLSAAIVFFLQVRRRPPDDDPDSKRPLFLVALFCVMAFTCNAVYCRLQMADLLYRTHVMSRVWTSLAIAIAAGWAVARWPRARAVVLAALALFVGFGTWGGLERQDLFLATWHRHQRELSSIVESVPAFRPGTGIILRSGATSYYLATEADYLAENWLVLLYDTPKVRVLRLTPQRGTACVPAPAGLDCQREKGNGARHFGYDKLIILDYDEASGRYSLVQSLAGADAYRPQRLIVQRPMTRIQRHLLLLD
jgi:hypothetical protein